jgi:hypothetical protein
MPRRALRCLLLACLAATLAAPDQRLAPRAALGSGGSTTFTSEGCAARFGASGAPLPAACARCTAPWLEATDDASGARVCRCMADCLPSAVRVHAATTPPVLPPPGDWTAAWDAEARAARGVQLVFGMGTGRCGTVTLAQLLRAQPGCGATFSHEQHPLLPWTQPSSRALLRAADARVRHLLQRRLRWDARGADAGKQPGAAHATPLVGDVASFYLPYTEAILAIEPAARFIILQRSRAAVAASFARKDPGVDLWRACANRTLWSPNHIYWAAAHPKYPCSASGEAGSGAGSGAGSMEEALGMYWDEYSSRSAALAAAYPDRVRVFASPEVFEDAALQRELLAWAGVQAPRVQTQLPRHNCKANCGAGDAGVAARRLQGTNERDG